MAGTIEVSQAQRNAELDGGKANWDSGYLRFYSGSRPTHPEDALGGAVMLCELRFGNPAWPAASGDGQRSANAITQDTSADAAGTAAFWRAFRSNGTTVIAQGDIGTGTGSINLNSTTIQAGASVSVTSFTEQLPE